MTPSGHLEKLFRANEHGELDTLEATRELFLGAEFLRRANARQLRDKLSAGLNPWPIWLARSHETGAAAAG